MEKKQGSVSHSTDRGNEASKKYYISEVNQACGKGTSFIFSRPYSEIRPAKLTNHAAHPKLRDIIK